MESKEAMLAERAELLMATGIAASAAAGHDTTFPCPICQNEACITSMQGNQIVVRCSTCMIAIAK